MTRRQIIQELFSNKMAKEIIDDFFNVVRKEWPEMDCFLNVEVLEENLEREKRNCDFLMAPFVFVVKANKEAAKALEDKYGPDWKKITDERYTRFCESKP